VDEALRSEILGHLTTMVGHGAEPRPFQMEAIEAVAIRRARLLLVQRTGWGKSAVYFIATRLLRDRGAGPTLLVSPLLALMRNQMEMAARVGVRAATINSTNPEEFADIVERLERDDVDLLLVSPERFNNERFRTEMLPVLAKGAGLLVIDEAHCISDWGHDFRPDYRRIVRVLELLPRGVPVLCTTATANDRVVEDVVAQLGRDLEVMRGSLDRESLSLSVLEILDPAKRMAWLAERIPSFEGSGIVYTLTVADTTRVAGFLRSQGISAHAYSGDTEHQERLELEERLLANDLKCLVATSALGMGFDKPDLGFVVHFQSPGSPIAYYQQVGRAGRALEHAPAVLLSGAEDRDIQDFFIETAFPPQQVAESVVHFLEEEARPVGRNEILARVNVKPSRLDGMLKILEVDGAVERVEGGYRRTLAAWGYPEERVLKVTEQRRIEQAAMVAYARTDGCLMEFLRRQLDDPDAAPCGRCANCTGEVPSDVVDRGLVDAARAHLQTADLGLEPRKQWPQGMQRVQGSISPDLRAEPGRVLSIYNDGGWGRLVKRGKFADGRFSDELVEAAATLVRDRWGPEPAPGWVTCVPSAGHPELVPNFGERLADALELPFVPVVQRVRVRRPQKEMENSHQQFRNVDGAFAVESALVRPEPVLLIDDIVDSRWTLTVIVAELRRAGSGPVHPLALARAQGT
jgi:ATP-dependent DNA helicase RecQ